MNALEQLLAWAKDNRPDLYELYQDEAYEKTHGPHFDEQRARRAVEVMHSTNERGEMECGEHWTVDQVQTAILPTQFMMRENDTIWDAYVALNMWYHDLGKNYRSHTDSYADLWMATDAMTWAFSDEDAKEGKIFRYIKSVA